MICYLVRAFLSLCCSVLCCGIAHIYVPCIWSDCPVVSSVVPVRVDFLVPIEPYPAMPTHSLSLVYLCFLAACMYPVKCVHSIDISEMCHPVRELGIGHRYSDFFQRVSYPIHLVVGLRWFCGCQSPVLHAFRPNALSPCHL
ncbi:hypothetical protein BJX68DRAFT_149665 [Aspergillus pseudodeflectus]|uniref:Secreted protein n=1 Tax=Aspergillus pseudodeflectus TaxID=176178 RepID=A0ABR4JW34_9EURO